MRSEYDRDAAVMYARRWALDRNPRFGDFSALGGDCANFASQCLWAGWGDMAAGWYYRSMGDRTASWSGVRFLREWLLLDGRAQLCRADEAETGDIVFLWNGARWYHVLVLLTPGVGATAAAHTRDALDRPLGDWPAVREYVHIF